jgi:nitrite reductase/ring-hydroxylating ferredoxin subunit
MPRTLRFQRRGLAIALVLAGFVVIAAVIATEAYPTGVSAPPDTPYWVKVMRSDILQPDQPVHIFDQKVWMVKLDTGEVLALYHGDPYLGCAVPWRPDFTFMNMKGWFRNPCQSQTYDLTGACFDGPCVRGLDRYETRVNNGDIEVRVGPGALIQGPPKNQTGAAYVPHPQ